MGEHGSSANRATDGPPPPKVRVRAITVQDISSYPAERAITAKISSNAVGRDKGVLLTAGLDLVEYLRNSIILFAHDHHIPSVGKAMWMKKQPKRNPIELIAKPRFAPTDFGEQMRLLYTEGFMQAFSISWAPREESEPTEDEIKEHPEWAEAGVRWVCRESELHEFSCVNVPALAEALVIEAEGRGIITPEFCRSYLGVDVTRIHSDAARVEDEGEREDLGEIREDPPTERPQGGGWDETDTSFRFRVRDPEKFEEGTLGTKRIDKGPPVVSAVFGRLIGETTTTLQSLIFPKPEDGSAGFTGPGAKAWLKEHSDILRADYDDPQRQIEKIVLPDPVVVVQPAGMTAGELRRIVREKRNEANLIRHARETGRAI